MEQTQADGGHIPRTIDLTAMREPDTRRRARRVIAGVLEVLDGPFHVDGCYYAGPHTADRAREDAAERLVRDITHRTVLYTGPLGRNVLTEGEFTVFMQGAIEWQRACKRAAAVPVALMTRTVVCPFCDGAEAVRVAGNPALETAYVPCLRHAEPETAHAGICADDDAAEEVA